MYNFIYYREINFLLSFPSQQGDDNQEILPQEERSIHPRPVEVSCSEATSERPAYLPAGIGVSKYEEIKHLEEKISVLEEDLQKERCNHMDEVMAIKEEISKVEQELNAARNQLQQTTRVKDNMADRLRAKEAEACAKDEQLRAKDTELHAKDEQMKVKEAELQVKDEQKKAKDILLQAKDEHIKAKDAELCARDERLKVKDSQLCAKDELLKAKESEARTKDEQLKSKDEQLKGKGEELSTKDEQLKQLLTTIEKLEAKYTELNEQQKAKDNKANSHIEKLEREKSQLEEELKTKKLEKATVESSQVTSEMRHQLQGAESQIIASTNNTGKCFCTESMFMHITSAAEERVICKPSKYKFMLGSECG
jgi:chromosome segregation ATPase